MVVDEVKITIKAGDGGQGKIHFAPMKGGPDGGNGGRGGDVYIVGTSDLTALNRYSGKPKLSAGIGEPGGDNKKTGRGGADLVLTMPVGTTVTDTKTGEHHTISNEYARTKIANGGHGGKGNFEFRSAVLRAPRIAEPGTPGQTRELFLNLQFFADIGIIGLPNAGKSSLLNALTKAQAKIAAYPFTTLEPNLGVYHRTILADIPGIIEGASAGKGLGLRFLKHISKVATLFHCISCESTDLLADYDVIRAELATYDRELLKKSELILLTKTDLTTEEDLAGKIKLLRTKNRSVLAISIIDNRNIKTLEKKIGTQNRK